MNLRAVGWLLGCVLLLLAGFLAVPAVVALLYSEIGSFSAFLASALVSAASGGALVWINRGATESKDGRLDYFRREGLAVVGLTWFAASAIGALPFLFGGTLRSPIDAFFESASGFTTTGATVFTAAQVDLLPFSIAFWRCFSHWLGGIGIVLVFVVLFPSGGRSLFRSEVSGVSREANLQLVRDSALALLRVYMALSVLLVLLLWVTGLSLFDAIVHAFATLGTGGFSNRGASVGFYGSWVVELILIVFMVAAGVNFTHWDAVVRHGPARAWKSARRSDEVRLYFGLIVGSSLVIGLLLWFWGGSNGQGGDLPDYRSFLQSLRDAAFAVASIQTSTGFATADFNRWPDICRMLLTLAAIVGACAGSTAGGIKVVRVVIVSRAAMASVLAFVRPRAIQNVRLDGHPLSPAFVATATRFFVLWWLMAIAGSLLLSLLGADPITAISAVIACLNNIGPGLGLVGPYADYGHLPELSKAVLGVLMIMGRLEFYAVVALLVPGFWRH